MVSSRSLALRSEGLEESGNVLGINNGDASSLNGPHERQQTSSSSWSRSEPSSLTPTLARTEQNSRGSSGPYSSSPTGQGDAAARPSGHASIRNFAPDDEERFEAFGAVDEDSTQSSGSPVAGGTNLHRNPRSPNSMLLNRHTWLRTSLGRTTNGANKKRLSSNALASQLYRSSSFNSSGRGSICDTADDVYSDVSLEDDVIDLNQRVQLIQDQMHALVDTQSAGEERYARVKQENATLQARILMLEEAARDNEARAQEKLEVEQRRIREYTLRLEREKELQLENYAIKLQAAEVENSRVKDEALRVREQLDRLRAEKSRLEAALEDAQQDLDSMKEAERQSSFNLVEVNKALKRTVEELAQKANLELRIEQMNEEIKNLRLHNKNLEESRDELQAAAAVLQAGRHLLMPSGQDPNDNTIGRKSSPNLATELRLTGTAHDQEDGTDTGKSITTDICDNFTSLAEAKQALKEQREDNARLRSYIDNILLNIVENYPQLLEVKQPH